MKRIAGVVMAAFFAALGAGLALSQNQSGYDLFQQALVKERAEGNVQGAIELYQRIVREFSGNRALAAKALVEMGECYEKLGKDEARKAYERVVRDYADQQEQATEARTRLAALTHTAGSTNGSMVARRIWAGPDVDTTGAPSLDGRYLTFVDWDTGDLAVRDLATGEKRLLTHKGSWFESTEYAVFGSISPDGREVAYSWFNKDSSYELRLIGLDGSKPRVLVRNEEVIYEEPFGWSPDGKYIAAIFSRKGGTNQLVLVTAADGSVRVLKSFDWRYPGVKAGFSPDGRYIAYDFPPKEDSPNRDIFVLAADGSREIVLVEHPANDILLGWAPDGKRVLFGSDRTGTMGAWAIQVADGKPAGSPELVKPDIGPISPLGFTRKGSYYYGVPTGMEDVYIATLDPATGKFVAPPVRATERFMGSNNSPDWSPDGEHLAYVSRRSHLPFATGPGAEVIVIRSTRTGEERELSPNLNYDYFGSLRWFADGHALLVGGNDRKNRFGFYRIDPQTGAVSSILQAEPGAGVTHALLSPSCTPDGKAIFYVRRDFKEKLSRIMVRDLATGKDSEFYSPGHDMMAVGGLALSSDGRRLSFTSSDPKARSTTLEVMAAAGGEPRELLRVKAPEQIPWNSLAWTPDGHYVVFAKGPSPNPQNQPIELWRVPVGGGEPQKIGVGMDRLGHVSFHPDGKQVAFSAGKNKSEVWVMENFLPMLRAAK